MGEALEGYLFAEVLPNTEQELRVLVPFRVSRVHRPRCYPLDSIPCFSFRFRIFLDLSIVSKVISGDLTAVLQEMNQGFLPSL